MGKITRTLSLMKMSWRLLSDDKKILIFPLMSLLSCIATMAVFIVPLFLNHTLTPPSSDATTRQTVSYYVLVFLFYYCNYFVIVFFNSALVSYIVMRMNGESPTIGDGLHAAFMRWPLIAGWALIAATVGFLLKMIEDRSEKIGQIVAAILGSAWGLVTFLVVPILVVEEKSPFVALKESTKLLKQTWGERIMLNFSFGTIMLVLLLPAVGVMYLAIASHSAVTMVVCGAVVVAYFILLSLVQSALEAIFQTAIYFYARHSLVPAGFDESDLQTAIAQR